MKKQYFYLSGLPRSGSTLLANILSQNPDIYVSETSTLPLVVESVKNQWDDLITNKSIPEELSRERQRGVLKGIINGYYENIDKPIIIDKSRQWPSLLETLNWTFEEKPKVIATVRDLRQIVESFEALYRKTSAIGMPHQFKGKGITTMETRAQALVGVDGVIGGSFEVLRDSVLRGWRNQILFVRYEDLGGNPAGTIQGIYDFLELPKFEHDFKDVQQVTFEDDRIHGFANLHDIEGMVRPAKLRNTLGDFGANFDGRNFWDNI